MSLELNIYDPVRVQLLDDITFRLLDKDTKCSFPMRVEAMSCISQLRNAIRELAPVGSVGYGRIKSKLLPDQLKMIYWEEYAAAEYAKIEARKKADNSGMFELMGA